MDISSNMIAVNFYKMSISVRAGDREFCCQHVTETDRTGRRHTRAALRGPRHLRPPAPHRRGGTRRRSRGRRALRLRRFLPSRRAVRPGPHPRLVQAAAALPPAAGRRAVRRTAGGRRRRHRGQPLRHRRGDHHDRARLRRVARRRHKADHPRRRPHHRVATAAFAAPRPRPNRRAALRCSSGHLGHLLRCAVHPRHAVPPGQRGRPARPRALPTRRDPGPALRNHRPDRRQSAGLSGDRHGRRATGRAARGDRTDAGPPRRRAGLRVDRHRRAGPGARARHRHPGGRRHDEPRATALSAKPGRRQPGWRGHRRGRPGLRPRRNHRDRGRARRATS